MGRSRKGGPPRGPGRPRADLRLERWLRSAFEAHGAGRLREAERLARRVTTEIPDQPDALHLLATIARESGRADLAIDLYQRLLRRHPAIPIAQNSLGNMLQERGEWGPAIACYEAALSHDPRYVTAYFNLGHALLLVREIDRAETYLRRAAALAPDDAQVRSRLARALVEQGRTEEAVTEAVRSVELDPESAALRNDLGTIHATMGEFDAARECYRTALAMDPGYAKAAVNLAKIKRFTAEDDPDAALILAANEHAGPDRASRRDLHLALGKLHDDRGDWDTAFMHYDEANRPFAEIARADADSNLKMMERVRTHFDAEWFAGHAAVTDVDPTPVFIVGMPRSGTSLVEQFLAAHPDVHGAGELSEIGRMVAEIASRAAATDPYPGCLRSLDSAAIEALGRRYLAHLRTRSPGSSRITDKLPGNYLHLGFIATILPGAKIVHCRRDPLDTAISLYFNDFESGHDYSKDLRAIGRQIRGMRALMTHWETVLDRRIFTVDYEALVADPESLARSVLRHVGLVWDDACLRPHEVPRPVHTASVWQVRQPVYRRSAGRAHHYARFLGPLRKALGESRSGR